jgi:hypothetical protein
VLSTLLADGQASGEFVPVDARWLAAFVAGGLGRVSQAAWRRGPRAPFQLPPEAWCAAVEGMVASEPPSPAQRMPLNARNGTDGAAYTVIEKIQSLAPVLAHAGRNGNGRSTT